MTKNSAGILLFRSVNGELEVLLAHLGGPYWQKKDDGSWSIPKGLPEQDEPLLEAAKREFKEETGFNVEGDFIELGQIKQPSKKIIHIWALEKDLDEQKVKSNTFTLEWPPSSGKIVEFPEIDKAAWFSIEEAGKKIIKGQKGFIDRLTKLINYIPSKQELKNMDEPKQGMLF